MCVLLYSLSEENPTQAPRKEFQLGGIDTSFVSGQLRLYGSFSSWAFKDRGGLSSYSSCKMELSVCRSTLLEHRELSLQDLPPKILVDIFLKLPVKCLLRMKCASKFCYAVVTNPRFIELQFEKAVKNPGHLYVFRLSAPYIYLAERVSGCVEAMKIPRRALFQRMLYTGVANWCTSGGLVASITQPSLGSEKCCYICNPILGEEIKVTMGPYFGKDYVTNWWGFGYSSSTKEYKLILFAHPLSMEKEVVRGAIYTLGSESWREIPDVPFIPGGEGHEDCDGTFFWLIYDNSGVPRTHTIASFDIGSEEFRLWQGPNTDMNQDSCIDLYLIRVGDTVGCVKEMNDSSLSIWILRDKVNEIWIKEYTSALRLDEFRRQPRFLGLWMNRDLFCQEDQFFTYDANNKQFKVLELPFHDPHWCPRYGDVCTHVLCLISPRRIRAMGNKSIGFR